MTSRPITTRHKKPASVGTTMLNSRRKELDGAVRMRKANESDVNFIFSSWLKSYRGSPFANLMSTTIFYSEHHKVLQRLLKTCDVTVACSDKDAAQLYGFICSERISGILVVHYVYVKRDFRWLGIGRKLLEAVSHDSNSASLFSHFTLPARFLAVKFNMVHSPYIAFTPEYRGADVMQPVATQEIKDLTEEVEGLNEKE